MAFLFFHGVLCDTLKKSRGKNLIIVPLLKRNLSKHWHQLMSRLSGTA